MVTGTTTVLLSEVDFNLAGPVCFDVVCIVLYCWYVGDMATWLTRLVSKAQTPKP
jgi:hypothetical protein